mmetsp:Transcript_20708/g.58080  ORF Transcript_20708/g.58080 Transcript_20708/m.58080 type:complete len:258 (-) Transcript_20708:1478-2251(-)
MSNLRKSVDPKNWKSQQVVISAARAKSRNTFWGMVILDHLVFSLYCCFLLSASLVFCQRLSCSGRGLESSVRLSWVSFAMKRSAMSITAPCDTPTPRMIIGLKDFRESSDRLAPPITHGTIRKKHGSVPSSICGKRRWRMPVRTEVGQSGPPTRIATFSIDSPSLSSIFCIARICTVWMPTSLWTYWYFPKPSPMTFCCIATALSLRMSPSTDAKQMPVQNESQGSSFPRATMIVPAAMYTGTPGTGGSRNMMMPAT